MDSLTNILLAFASAILIPIVDVIILLIIGGMILPYALKEENLMMGFGYAVSFGLLPILFKHLFTLPLFSFVFIWVMLQYLPVLNQSLWLLMGGFLIIALRGFWGLIILLPKKGFAVKAVFSSPSYLLYMAMVIGLSTLNAVSTMLVVKILI